MAINKESINTGLFDKKFKNSLRDYYAYGFENMKSESSSASYEIWNRLNYILGENISWSQKPSKIMYASTDSQSNAENPFHRVYRFCHYNETNMSYFFHIILALASETSLPGGIESLKIEQHYYMPKMKKEEIVESLSEELKKDLAKPGKRTLSTKELYCFYPDTILESEGNYPNLNNHLTPLTELGLVQYKNARWSLSSRTLPALLKAGEKANPDFREHFKTALDFYSKYYPLGEIGTFILDRFGEDKECPFRFKHEYYMQSLNDYNLIDLLYAIENNYWCRITYSSGISNTESELLCLPLEIRVSSSKGREYLAYYEPFSREYSFLRLEFIDSIVFYKDKDIKTQLSFSESTIKTDLKKIREALAYTWGTSASPLPNCDASENVPVQTVAMRISYDCKAENFIKDRLYREKRHGKITNITDQFIDFEIQVTDPHELTPWIRSFYGRIISISGMENKNFTIKGDLERFQQSLADENISDSTANLKNSENWTLSQLQREQLDILKPVVSETKVYQWPHWQLFNEVFSVYYDIEAHALMNICKSAANGTAVLPEEIDAYVKEAFDKYKDISGKNKGRNLTEEQFEEALKYMLKCDSGVDRFQSKCFVKKIVRYDRASNNYIEDYDRRPIREGNQDQRDTEARLPIYSVNQDVDFYKDLLPLTTLECRWILTIINDDKIKYFMSEDEINAIKAAINTSEMPPLKTFPTDKVIYFDRFSLSESDYSKEQAVFGKLLTAIRERHIVELGSEKCKPILIEYSKRDDRMRCYFQKCTTGKIFLRNLSSIHSLKLLGDVYDYSEAKLALNKYRENGFKEVTVQFRDVKNVPDRILIELSPWKKECTYDSKNKIYTLTIHYHSDDTRELVIRLMGYGADIFFSDKKNPICMEITDRINRQLSLWS